LNALEVWSAIKRAGLTAAADGGALRVRPATGITPELAAAIKEHKRAILRLAGACEVSPEGAERIESIGEVIELSRLRGARPFDPAEHPPSKMGMWADPDKERFYFPERFTDEGGTA
jgi:hypothetical protein